MAEIPLNHGLVAVVDDDDFAWLSCRKWRCHVKPTRRVPPYAVSGSSGLRMHRLILGLVSGDGLEADHINGNRLDNRRSNLRVCTHAENMQNYPAREGASRFRGVNRVPRGRWRAQVWVDGKNRHVGTFATEEEAALAAEAFRAARKPFAVSDRAVRVAA